jgi:hypothetical protein
VSIRLRTRCQRWISKASERRDGLRVPREGHEKRACCCMLAPASELQIHHDEKIRLGTSRGLNAASCGVQPKRHQAPHIRGTLEVDCLEVIGRLSDGGQAGSMTKRWLAAGES